MLARFRQSRRRINDSSDPGTPYGDDIAVGRNPAPVFRRAKTGRTGSPLQRRATQTPQVSTAAPTDRIRVLIVDDDAAFARAMMTSLSEDGRIDVVGTAKDGHEALQLSRTLRPDVLLLDLNMPRLDGYEVMRRISRRKHQPAIIVLTGVTDRDELDRAARLHPDALLPKTVDADTVVFGVVLAIATARRPSPPKSIGKRTATAFVRPKAQSAERSRTHLSRL
jgi:DNA-binding NarL/FixJ family response regulator